MRMITIILNNSLIEEIIKNHYNLGEIESINSLESGHESDNFKVTTEKGEYVIKYFPYFVSTISLLKHCQQLISFNL